MPSGKGQATTGLNLFQVKFEVGKKISETL